mmetsp:Transcript_15175/g.27014  ORF Transcript_15175/g.27014 Transcript_15175/m.27014 type:complete len:82 (-) Transcript_15175:1107-1352(-)
MTRRGAMPRPRGDPCASGEASANGGSPATAASTVSLLLFCSSFLVFGSAGPPSPFISSSIMGVGRDCLASERVAGVNPIFI